MKQFRIGLMLVAGVLALSACASKGPAEAAAPVSGSAPKGYRLVVKKGTEYYCRTEAVTGSHTLKNEVCVTPEEYAADRIHGVATGGGLNTPNPAQVGGR
jgi:hypothetical protein